jgi:hypothetical protein
MKKSVVKKAALNARANKTSQIQHTLDQKHTDKLQFLDKVNESLPEKKKYLAVLRRKMELLDKGKTTSNGVSPKSKVQDNAPTRGRKNSKNACDNNSGKVLNNAGIDQTQTSLQEKFKVLDEIQMLENDIAQIESGEEFLDYFGQTVDILADYYDVDNAEYSSDEEAMITLAIDAKRKPGGILGYFNKEIESQKANNIIKNNSTSKISQAKVAKCTKAELNAKYLQATGAISTKINRQTCPLPKCEGEMIPNHNAGHNVCRKCGLTMETLISTDKPSYKEPTQDNATAYKRSNHLTEILGQLQAKCTVDIPADVFTQIGDELRKRGLNKDHLNIRGLRQILQNLDLKKYYEHVPYLLLRINGTQPPSFSRDVERKIKQMFKDIQIPFAIYCPSGRVNFLNYYYVLKKFCEILGLDSYAKYFPPLKNAKKLLEHDKVWKNICQYMDWPYKKSI